MAKHKLPDQKLLLNLFTYNPISGKCFWNIRSYDMYDHEGMCDKFNNQYAGKELIENIQNGYIKLTYKGITYPLHRCIWKQVYGTDPDIVDHIDGNIHNNALINLRNVSTELNNKNTKKYITNKTDIVGVSWHKKYQKWQAYINVNKKLKILGQFVDINDAINARKSAEKEYGYHENHGR